MKKTVLFLVVLCLFCFFGINKVYSEDLSVSQRIERENDNFMRNEKVVKITKYTKSGWNSFKKWLGNLPGIRNYNNSVYSSKQYKTAKNDMGNGNNSYLQKNSANTSLLKEDKKNWDNL
ncbi:MAG: hypothetical protein IKO48_04660 [Elusimicrobia bacterium]|nr:hypothetical protein [Elusimicrobiota bacterium]